MPVSRPTVTDVDSGVRDTLRDVLQIGQRADQMTADTPLLGEIPELDSMAVASLMLALEDRFDITIHDDEVSAELFETFGSLKGFMELKMAGR